MCFVVERTLAWLGRNRRLSKDHERLPATGEMLLHAGMSRILLRRLTTHYATQLLGRLLEHFQVKWIRFT
jgi:hypothetical protein